jgi:hypothetical protein
MAVASDAAVPVCRKARRDSEGEFIWLSFVSQMARIPQNVPPSVAEPPGGNVRILSAEVQSATPKCKTIPA